MRKVIANEWVTLDGVVQARAEQQGLAEPLNALPKYVASTTLDEPLGWRNSAAAGDRDGFRESARRPPPAIAGWRAGPASRHRHPDPLR